MKFLKTLVAVLFLAAVAISLFLNPTVSSQSTNTGTTDQANVARTTDATSTPDSVDLEGVPADDQTTYTFSTSTDPSAATLDRSAPCFQTRPGDAPTGFDDRTNGLIPQGRPPEECTDPTPGTFLHDKAIFEEIDVIEDGLGPVYNAQGCSECHQNPVTGAISQITELRAGHNVGTTFVDAPGGSLINHRGIPTPNYNGDPRKSAKVQERVPPLYTAGIIGGGPAITAEEPVRTFRTSLNTLGDGFVEAIANGSLIAIANNQPVQTGNEVHGLPINVPVLEAPTHTLRVGRFGWKDQHASLVSFSGDAYLNEIGITNFLVLNENTSLGRFVGFGSGFDTVPDNTPCADDPTITCGEDTEQDVNVFAEFMRATKAPPRDPDIIAQFQADVTAGAQLFAAMVDQQGNLQYSCSVCHVPAIITVPACTVINGGTFTVPPALANKIIRPFGDFLLHDVGTGDGIVQNGGQITRTKVRTPPLWGVRTRATLMHDGESLTFNEAILRHSGEAAAVRARYQLLSPSDKRKLITFLESL